MIAAVRRDCVTTAPVSLLNKRITKTRRRCLTHYKPVRNIDLKEHKHKARAYHIGSMYSSMSHIWCCCSFLVARTVFHTYTGHALSFCL